MDDQYAHGHCFLTLCLCENCLRDFSANTNKDLSTHDSDLLIRHYKKEKIQFNM